MKKGQKRTQVKRTWQETVEFRVNGILPRIHRLMRMAASKDGKLCSKEYAEVVWNVIIEKVETGKEFWLASGKDAAKETFKLS